MRFLHCLLLIFGCGGPLVLTGQDCDNPDTPVHEDYAALEALYYATDGDNWVERDGWLSNCDPCSGWAGISCNSDDRVVSIELSNNGLSGQLPANLGELTELVTLSLINNEITGSLPNSIGNLQALTIVHLDNNNISGPLPSSFYNLNNAFSVTISSNPLNQQLPEEIGNLSALKIFSAQRCGLIGPIPEGIANLSQLERLNLQENNLSGEIPESLGYASSLTWLNLRENELNGELPSSIGSLSNLEHLQISQNELAGSIPSEIGDLLNLVSLRLHDNQLTGSIPHEIGNAYNLATLDLANNDLSGPIPTSLTMLSGIRTINLSWNSLTGEIPEGFGNVESLILILCRSNDLSGCYPDDLLNYCCNQTQASSFFGNNKLPWQGAINSFWNGATQIGAPCDDGISDNGFPDQINEDCSCGPPPSCDHPDYAALEAFYNATDGDNWTNNTGWLTDCEPCSWEGITCTFGRVTRLILPNHNLTGPLPAAMNGLTSLSDVNLNNNSLSGPVPSFFAGHPNLKFLRLGFNQLTGTIAPEMGQVPKLRWLDLQRNDLFGELPASLGTLPQAQMLSFRGNKLDGGIPAEYGQLSNTLGWLDLRDNDFSGCLEDPLLDLCGQTNVKLAGNPLLPWEGNFQNFCDGLNQQGANCSVGTTAGVILEECTCGLGGKFIKLEKQTTTTLRVYPNPVSGTTITVELPAGTATLRLLTTTGREVMQMTALNNRVEVPVNGLKPGFYLLTVDAEEGYWVRKVVIR